MTFHNFFTLILTHLTHSRSVTAASPLLQPVAKVVETSYLNERKLLTALLRAIFLSGRNFNADNNTFYCNCSLLKGNSTFLEIISCRDTNHWKKVFYLDLFGAGPVWISIHGDINVSLYVYLNCYISNLYGDLTP